MSALHTRSLKNSLPKYSWRHRTTNPSLFYFTNHHDANALLARIPYGPLGFDLEWRPNFTKGKPENCVALVQLATADTVVLLHIHFMTQFPSELTKILRSPYWVKTGVSIQYDCEKLYRDYGISVCNCVELSFLARTVDNPRWKGKYSNKIGLARLVEAYEQVSLAKGKTRCSDWEQYLTSLQQEYAANDAHAGYMVYCRLLNMAQAMNLTPLPIYYSFSVINGLLRDVSGFFPWNAHNPYYDPGPPPPPKCRDAKKDDKKRPGPVTPGE